MKEFFRIVGETLLAISLLVSGSGSIAAVLINNKYQWYIVGFFLVCLVIGYFVVRNKKPWEPSPEMKEKLAQTWDG